MPNGEPKPGHRGDDIGLHAATPRKVNENMQTMTRQSASH